jgi:hypothetical protein
MALVVAPVAGLAGLQAARSWRRVDDGRLRPIDGLSALGAALLVVGAAFGVLGLAIGVGGLAVAISGVHRLVVTRHELGRVRVPRSYGRTLLLAVVPGAAGAAPVALRSISAHGAVPALALCTYALVYDASAFLFGSGATHVWEGPVAGIASIGAVTIAVAAILVPPFSGSSPWLLGAVAALATPLGPLVASAVLGDRRARAPALRRLDALVVLGPVWTMLALAIIG